MTEALEVFDRLRGCVSLDSNNRVGAIDRIDHPARPGLRLRCLDPRSEAPHGNLQQELGLVIASPGPE